MSSETRLLEIRPVIPAKDMHESLTFYKEKLGFRVAFAHSESPGDPVNYAGVERGEIGFHLQAMVPGQDDAMPLVRIRVQNIDPLYQEYKKIGAVSATGALESKPWGTKEFGLYDPNGAALVFYEIL